MVYNFLVTLNPILESIFKLSIQELKGIQKHKLFPKHFLKRL